MKKMGKNQSQFESVSFIAREHVIIFIIFFFQNFFSQLLSRKCIFDHLSRWKSFSQLFFSEANFNNEDKYPNNKNNERKKIMRLLKRGKEGEK